MQAIKLRAVLLFMCIAAIFSISNAQNALPIPPVINSNTINLNLENHSDYSFYAGTTTNTMGINGKILGPTLILTQNKTYNFNVKNKLPDSTTIHWHGLHVSADNDGGPHSIIKPGDTWKPTFKILDKAATYWYHPHLHSKTNLQVSKGMAGMIIVKDAEEDKLDLPRTYGKDDFPLILQTKEFNKTQEITLYNEMDTAVVTNGVVNAYLDAPAQVIRLRLLNGTSQRVLNLGLSNNDSLHMIASDGGLLAKPVALSRLLLAPGERAEVLVNLIDIKGNLLYLKNYGTGIAHGIYGAKTLRMTIPNYANNKLNGADFNFLKINVKKKTSNAVTKVVDKLIPQTPYKIIDVDKNRTLVFRRKLGGGNGGKGPFTINGKSFDMNVINETILLNNTEVWTITNRSPIAHPFHIHDIQFYILERNGIKPPLHERGRKDVILVNHMETIKFITKFEDFSDDKVPYMYHCHMLTHEDDGMMGQFRVVRTLGLKNTKNNILNIYPNPINNALTIVNKNKKTFTNFEIIDMQGKIVLNGKFTPRNLTINLHSLSNGIYILKVNDGKKSKMITRFVKK